MLDLMGHPPAHYLQTLIICENSEEVVCLHFFCRDEAGKKSGSIVRRKDQIDHGTQGTCFNECLVIFCHGMPLSRGNHDVSGCCVCVLGKKVEESDDEFIDVSKWMGHEWGTGRNSLYI